MGDTEALASVLDTIFSPGFKPVTCHSVHFNSLDYIGVPIVGQQSDGKQNDVNLTRGQEIRTCCKSLNENHGKEHIRLCDLNRKKELKKIACLETSGYHVVRLDDYQEQLPVPLDINANIIEETDVCAHSFEDGDPGQFKDHIEMEVDYDYTQDIVLIPEITKVESLSEISFGRLDSQTLEHRDLHTETFNVSATDEAAFTNDKSCEPGNVEYKSRKYSKDNTANVGEICNDNIDEKTSEMSHDIDREVSANLPLINANTVEKNKMNSCSGNFEIYIDVDCIADQMEKCNDPNDILLSQDSPYGTEQTEKVRLNDTVKRADDKNLSGSHFSAFGVDITATVVDTPLIQQCSQNTSSKCLNEPVKRDSKTETNICSKSNNIKKRNIKNFDEAFETTRERKYCSMKTKEADSELQKHFINVREKVVKKHLMTEIANGKKSNESDSNKVKCHGKHEKLKDREKVKATKVNETYANKVKFTPICENEDVKKLIDEKKNINEVTGQNDIHNFKTSFANKQTNSKMKNYLCNLGQKGKSVNDHENIQDKNKSLVSAKDIMDSETSFEQQKMEYTNITISKLPKNIDKPSFRVSKNPDQKAQKLDSCVKEKLPNKRNQRDKEAKVNSVENTKLNSKLLLQDEGHKSERNLKSSLKSTNTAAESKEKTSESVEAVKVNKEGKHSKKTVRSLSSRSRDKTELIGLEQTTESHSKKNQKDVKEKNSTKEPNTETDKKNAQLNYEKTVKELRKDRTSDEKGNLNEKKANINDRKSSCASAFKNLRLQPEKDTKRESDLSESEQSRIEKSKQGMVDDKINDSGSTRHHRHIVCAEKDKEYSDIKTNRIKQKKRKLSSSELNGRTAKKRVLEWLEHHVSENVIDKEPCDSRLKQHVSQMKFKIPKRAKNSESNCHRDRENMNSNSKDLHYNQIECEHNQKSEERSKNSIPLHNLMDKRSIEKIKDRKRLFDEFKNKFKNENLNDEIASSKQKQHTEKMCSKKEARKKACHISERKPISSLSHVRRDMDLLNDELFDNASDHKKLSVNISRTNKKLSLSTSRTESKLLVDSEVKGNLTSKKCRITFNKKTEFARHKEQTHNRNSSNEVKDFAGKSCNKENSLHRSEYSNQSNSIDKCKSDRRLKDDNKTSGKCEASSLVNELLYDDTQIAPIQAKSNAKKNPDFLSKGYIDKAEDNKLRKDLEQQKNEDIEHVKKTNSEKVITKDTVSSVTLRQTKEINAIRNNVKVKQRMHKCEICEKAYFSESKDLMRHKYFKHSDRKSKQNVYNSSGRKRKLMKFNKPEFGHGKRGTDQSQSACESNQDRKCADQNLSTVQDQNITTSPKEINLQNSVNKDVKNKLKNLDTQIEDNWSMKTKGKEESVKPLLSLDVKPSTEKLELAKQIEFEGETKCNTTERCKICNMIFFRGSMQRHFRIAHPKESNTQFTCCEAVSASKVRGSGYGQNLHSKELNSFASTKWSKDDKYQGGVKASSTISIFESDVVSPQNQKCTVEGILEKENNAKTDERSPESQTIVVRKNFNQRSSKIFHSSLFKGRNTTESHGRFQKCWQCRKCKVRFSTKRNLKRHITLTGHYKLLY